MKSIRNLRALPAGSALLADDLLEFHAARLLLLLRICGVSNRVDGLTKLAKLDFFARYPSFFASACAAVGTSAPPVLDGIEAPMVRHHYGPWDKRYYHILAFLEGAQLVAVAVQANGSYRFTLTADGVSKADILRQSEAFSQLSQQMQHLKRVFGSKSGDTLKRFIYEQFDREVANRSLGQVIR